LPASIFIELTDKERKEFHRRCRSGKTAVRVKERLSIVLLADEGLTNTEIAEHVPLSAHAIGRWRKRFSEEGLSGIEKNKPRGLTMNPSKNADYAKLRQQIVEITTREKPEGATHWSTRTLAAKLGTNHKFVSRVWRDNGLKPHLVKSFKVSNDPNFEEKLADVVGLYMNPPFLKTVKKQTPEDMDLHIIVDNYSTHKHQKVKNWLKRNKVTLHFIPTSSSWLNLVERFFGLITDKAIRRGVFSSVKDLEEKLMAFISKHNEEPTPFVWTKSVEVILEKVNRAREKLI